MVLMSIGKFAKELGVTPEHVRTMHRTGEVIPARISEKGTRYYSEEQLRELKNSRTPQREEKVVAYCRVSTKSQKDELEKQVENVKSYMYAKGYSFEVIADIGSGINYKNKGLQELVTLINSNQVTKVVVLHKDRLVQFGFELIQLLCDLHNVEIEIIDNSERSNDEELTNDLIEIITVFANRLYGSRSKKTRTLIERVSDVTRD
jgi:predicted site-specific integrase-resolvase